MVHDIFYARCFAELSEAICQFYKDAEQQVILNRICVEPGFQKASSKVQLETSDEEASVTEFPALSMGGVAVVT